MSRLFLLVGVALLSYDWVGHLWCAVATIEARYHKSYLADLWNRWSYTLYPPLPRPTYDIHWSVIHGLALVFFVSAYILKPQTV